MVILIMALSASFNVWITNVSLGSFGRILNDNSKCNDFQDALDLEIKALNITCAIQMKKPQYFHRVAQAGQNAARGHWLLIIERSEKSAVPEPGSIRNAYESYKVHRDDVGQREQNRQ